MTFKDYYDKLYKKYKYDIDIDNNWNIVMTKWMGYNQNNIQHLKKVIPYFYYLDPKEYFILLFANIPKCQYPPFLKKIDNAKEKDDLFIDRIKEILGWTNREVEANKEILNMIFVSDIKEWKKRIGVK
jgi:uncharacterized FlgJ-related protein